jgi:transcriptional regulator with XRE-family HTH domain
MQGRVVLDAGVLKQLRNSRQLSQEELANECANRHFRVSISSIKRAETGKPVLFRIARELAHFYDVPADRLIGVNASAATSDAISLADEPLNLKDPGGPITGDYDLNRLKGQLLKLLGLPEKSILYLLETAELARNDSQRCEAWCELTDAYLSANRRGEAQEALPASGALRGVERPLTRASGAYRFVTAYAGRGGLLGTLTATHCASSSTALLIKRSLPFADKA